VGTDDTWEWDGVTWSLRNPTSRPTGRIRHALAYDANHRRVVLFGGLRAPNYVGDTWEWDGATWRLQAVAAAPSARENHAMAHDAGRGQLVLFGGWDFQLRGDTWTYRHQADVAAESCTYGFDGDADGTAGCSDPDCWGLCSPLCAPGMAACDPAGPDCGDGSCAAVESCRVCPGDCGACAALCGDFWCDAGETAGTCPGDCG
jgi:hypothetical protein